MLINTKSTITDSLDLLQKADVIVVFAGAGMSVDSGIEQFRGNDGIWTKSILINGEKVDYPNLMTHNAFIEKPELAWGLIGNLIKKYTSTTPHKGYSKLLNILSNKEYFIITSNCDEQFQKAGFDENKILECHGSAYDMQCLNIKHKEIWITPKVDVNIKTNKAEAIPKCPECGSNCRPNISLFGDWFWLSTKAKHQQERYINWKKETLPNYDNIVALEIGAGKTIPTIRKAAENFSKNKYPLIRLNPKDFSCNQANHISIPLKAEEFLLLI
ncbi:MAG: NAD-dependent deacetylase [Flavobacteriales bacterium]|nr:NAD-dependent deacetylase [Flavobacteriales bacterium]